MCERGPVKDIAVSNEAKVTVPIPIWPVSFACSHRLGCSLIRKPKLSRQSGRMAGKQIIRVGNQTTGQALRWAREVTAGPLTAMPCVVLP